MSDSIKFCTPREPRPKSIHKFYIYRNVHNLGFIGDCLQGKVHISYSDKFNDPFDCKFNQKFSVDWYCRQPPQNMFNIITKDLSMTLAQKMEIFVAYQYLTNGVGWLTYKEALSLINQCLPIENRVNELQFIDKVESFFNERNPVFSYPYKVACFSEKYDSNPMWAYYADANKGVCIEYDFSLLDQNNIEQKELADNIYPVNYSYRRPKEDISMDSDSFFWKGIEWRHEKEWRIVCATSLHYLTLPCVSAIYLGAFFRMNEQSIKSYVVNTIHQLNKGIAIYEMRPQLEQYKLFARKITLDDVVKM